MLKVSQPNSVHDSEVEMELKELEALLSDVPYEEYPALAIQLAIAERLDGILTEMKDWGGLIRVGSDGFPRSLKVDIIQ